MNQENLESQERIEEEWRLEDQWPSENEWRSPLREMNGSGGKQDDAGTERPSKIRKQEHPPTTANTLSARKAKQRAALLDADFFVSIYGFSPSEFIPLIAEPQRKLDSRLCRTLCDDSLGKCLFGGYLTTVDTVRLATVSKRFQDLARGSVQRLDLSRLPNLTPLEVRNIVARYPSLTNLNLDYCPQFGDEHLQELAPLVSLEQLSLRGSSVSGDAISALLRSLASKNPLHKGTSLTLLDLSATTPEQSMNIHDEAMKSIANFCPKLQILRLSWCKAVTDDGLLALAQALPERLSQLDLALTCISNQGLSALKQLVYRCPIDTLDVSASNIHADALLASLAAINAPLALTDLKLEFLEDLSVQCVVKFFASAVSQRLDQFELSHCSLSTSETTEEVVREVIHTALVRNRKGA